MEKKCITCEINKPLTEFHKRTDSLDGRRSQCKECRGKKLTINYNVNKLKCTTCYILKDLNENNFYQLKNKNNGYGFRRVCIDCHNLYSKNKHLELKYDLNIELYNEMVLKQNKKCLICEEDKKLVVDHNHITGEVRGLLCDTCNRGIGYLHESNKKLLNAIKYLNPLFTDEIINEILKILNNNR